MTMPLEENIICMHGRIRPIVEYACPVWHTRLTKKQSKLLESIQKWAVNILKPNMKYTEPLTLFKATTLHERRTQLCRRFFQGILNPKHKLHYLLGDAKNVSIELRKPKIFPRPKAKTNRFKNSLVCDGLTLQLAIIILKFYHFT